MKRRDRDLTFAWKCLAWRSVRSLQGHVRSASSGAIHHHARASVRLYSVLEFTLDGGYADGYRSHGRRTCSGRNRAGGTIRSSVPVMAAAVDLQVAGALRQLDGGS